MKNILNKKVIIILCILICVIILSIILFANRENIIKVISNRLAENENELIDLTVQVKKTSNTERKCLVTITSNDSREKIKSVEYPSENEEEPYVIECVGEGKQQVGIDYVVEKGKEDKKFKITTASGTVIEKNTKYTINYDANGGDEINKKTIGLKGEDTNLEVYAKRNGFVFLGWAKESDATEAEIDALYDADYNYGYTQGDEDVILYAVWKPEDETDGKDLIDIASKITTSNNEAVLHAYTKEYSADIIYYDGNLTLDGTTEVQGSTLTDNVYEFGDSTNDVGSASGYAQNTVILKVNGNLTVNSGVTLTACKSDTGHGGPKGMLIYCTGRITNYGKISMTARGAYAEGQDVVLWKNEIGSYEFVPANGANGADGSYSGNSNIWGQSGKSASSIRFKRATGGGGSGAASKANSRNCNSGAGGKGTSFSGGTGSGAITVNMTSNGAVIWSGAGAANGGAGGNHYNNAPWVGGTGGGAGNPGGSGSAGGTNGTGGLLIIYANELINENNAIINANGVNGGDTTLGGGSSGGGSVNIFYEQSLENNGSIVANGGSAVGSRARGGAGGIGSVTIGNISTGNFIED